VPALSALLADTAFEIVGNLAPILGAIHLHLLYEHAIFFFCPRAFYHFGIKYFLPPVETLHISPKLEALGNFFPIFGAHLFYQILQLFILNNINLFAFIKLNTYLGFCPVSLLRLTCCWLIRKVFNVFSHLQAVTVWIYTIFARNQTQRVYQWRLLKQILLCLWRVRPQSDLGTYLCEWLLLHWRRNLV